jgi:O-antigen/teichoic acid export membrane protein
LFQNLLIGLGAVAAGNALELLTNAAKVAALLLIFVAGLASVGTVVGGWLVGLALGVPWAWWQVRRRCAEPPRPSPALLRATLPYGVKAYLVALLSFLTTKVVDVYFLKRYRGLEELGQYAIAAALAQQVALFPQVLGSLIFPRLCQAGSWGRKVQLVRRALLGLVLVMVPGTLAALMLARWFIGRCFGSAFVAAAEPFAWMLPGVFLWSLESVARLLLQTDGFRPSVVGAWVVTLGVATAANAWLVPQYGMTGAAMASSLALGFLALTTAGLVTVEGARQRRQL